MNNRTTENQRGSASIFVSLTVLVMLSLISLTFLVLMSKNYAEANDRRLKSQALYAAESAVSDVRAVVYNRINQFLTGQDEDGNNITDPDELIEADLLHNPFDYKKEFGCAGKDNPDSDYKPQLNPDKTIEYTCVNVNSGVSSIEYDKITPDKSRVAIIQTRKILNRREKQNINKMTISWQNKTAGNGVFTKVDNPSGLLFGSKWTSQAPPLRIELIPLNLKDGFNRDTLNDGTRVFVLYPVSADSTITKTRNGSNISSGFNLWGNGGILKSKSNSGDIIPVKCNGSNEFICSIEIGDLNQIGDADGDKTIRGDVGDNSTKGDGELVYVMKIRPFYNTIELRLEDAKGNEENGTTDDLIFINNQVKVIATGRSGTALESISERLPVFPDYDRPEYAIDTSTNICKLITGNPDIGIEIAPDFDNNNDYKDIHGEIGLQNINNIEACQPLIKDNP